MKHLFVILKLRLIGSTSFGFAQCKMVIATTTVGIIAPMECYIEAIDIFRLAYPSWMVVLGFNATLTARVISWQSVTHMCFLAFSHQY